MSTLAEFLLARIAEDEERGRNCQNWSECGEGYGCPAHMGPERWAAECETKRRIVEHETTTGRYRYRNTRVSERPSRTLRLLALPYADHPDYRQEEWKP